MWTVDIDVICDMLQNFSSTVEDVLLVQPLDFEFLLGLILLANGFFDERLRLTCENSLIDHGTT